MGRIYRQQRSGLHLSAHRNSQSPVSNERRLELLQVSTTNRKLTSCHLALASSKVLPSSKVMTVKKPSISQTLAWPLTSQDDRRRHQLIQCHSRDGSSHFVLDWDPLEHAEPCSHNWGVDCSSPDYEAACPVPFVFVPAFLFY